MSERTTLLDTTDSGNARRFAHIAEGRILWQESRRKWLVYDGKCWAADDTREVYLIADEVVRALYVEIGSLDDKNDREALSKWANQSESVQKIRAMLELAKPLLPVTTKELDTDGWALNVANGTIDMRKAPFTYKEHRPADLITKLCPVEFQPDATCPIWESFLLTLFQGSERMVYYVQQILASALVGDLFDHRFFIFHGAGRNGKSTLIRTAKRIWGNYWTNLSADALTSRGNDPQGFLLVGLPGSRVVTATESGQNRRLNEPLVKLMTSGDPMNAAHKHGDTFTFTPVFTSIMATNHKPTVAGQDEAIWARIRLIPFTYEIPVSERMPDFAVDKLFEPELAGILNWMLDGVHSLMTVGFSEPSEVMAATQLYRSDEDVLADWLDERCVIGTNEYGPIGELHKSYLEFTESSEDRAVGKRIFGRHLDDRGYASEKKTGGTRVRKGLRLL